MAMPERALTSSLGRWTSKVRTAEYDFHSNGSAEHAAAILWFLITISIL